MTVRQMPDPQHVIDAVVAWARTRPDVVAVGLAGSHARGTARPSSDVDLVLLVEDPAALLGDEAWLAEFGDVTSVADEDWGALQSRRVHYRPGPEAEFGLASPGWARLPLDAGTARVVRDGFRVLHDPEGLLAGALRAAAPSTDDLVVDDDVVLRPFTAALVPDLIAAVRESHAHLQPWMLWATADYDEDDAAVFVELVESGDERAYAILSDDGTFHGICALNRVDPRNRTANLGYWLRASSTGQGLMTRAVARLLVHGLGDLQLERVEVVTSVANAPSAAVARRLHLQEEGVRSRAIRVGDDQHDARVFAAFPSDLDRLVT